MGWQCYGYLRGSLLACRPVFPVVKMNGILYAEFCKRIAALQGVAGGVQEKDRAGCSHSPGVTNLNQNGILSPGYRAHLPAWHCLAFIRNVRPSQQRKIA